MEEIPNPYVNTWQTNASEISRVPGSSREDVIRFALKHRSKRVVVTPLIAAACVVMFIVVSIADKSVISPSAPVMIAFGANFVPAVVFRGESWRLFTSMFLHFGLIHLAMNLWCLSTSGPVLERFLGSVPYAVLYVLAGLGGSIASLWVHPTGVGAGASGAIFGVFGGLLGYLAVRRHEVPTAILQPMRSGVMAFVFYNVVLGFSNPTTDNAAHLGGLVTGFLTGLLLTSAQAFTSGRFVRLIGQLAVMIAVAAGLTGLERKGVSVTEGRIRNDPKLGPLVLGEFEAAPAYIAFVKASQPVRNEFDRIQGAIIDVLKSLGNPQKADDIDAMLNTLPNDTEALGKRIAAIPSGNGELVAMRSCLSSARDRQDHIVNALRKVRETGNASILSGPEGLKAQLEGYNKDFTDLDALRDTYFKKYGLVDRGREPSPKSE